ncbi:hypothetical protein GOAMR_54_00050 [Gordonia amarae NBRC 15530]|uniref:Uncharacterized protein n=2 Tax=Gordonia amarae TaxID=36821 RepID=G7GSC0_9ACTN|nr:hypothetical protein GOAMR_54_00050 [Gordonia amarae NBRC 15530]
MGRRSIGNGGAASKGAPTATRRVGRAQALTGLALVVLLAGGVLVWRSLADGCGGDRDKVTVIADSSMADPLKALTSIASDESCYDFRVAQVPSTADEASLKRIADATGGTSYIARTPNDISGIFTTEITKWMKD